MHGQQNVKLPTLTAQCSGVPNILTSCHFFLLVNIISEAGFLIDINVSRLMLNVRKARCIKEKVTKYS